MKKKLWNRLDPWILFVPLIVVVSLCLLFILLPEQSKLVLNLVRGFLGDGLGLFYILIGCGSVAATLYMAFSKFGKIRLGSTKQPEYTDFQWGSIIFTSTMAADILFYSLCEWMLYANEPYVASLGPTEKWAPTFALFHWGPTAWSFYVLLAVSFGFMIHVRGREKQKFSEVCRPILGDWVDKIPGRIIDLLAVIALLAGTATTFSVSSPLLSAALSTVFGIPDGIGLSILILISIAVVYTLTVWFGMKGIAKLASICTYLFFFFIGYVLLAGGETRFILESGVSSVGNLLQNFLDLSTWTDPLRTTSFVQNWTVFYWSYWMAWCVATPFFIGMISKGRTVKNTVLGAYGWGLAGTFTSFIVLGGYGLATQLKGSFDALALMESQSLPHVIIGVLKTLPLPNLVLIVLVITMVAFYATTFDALTMVVSNYSYKSLLPEEHSDKRLRVFWAVIFILFPIGLIFSQSTMFHLQSASIIAAFPIGIIICLIGASFFKDASAFLKEQAALDSEKTTTSS